MGNKKYAVVAALAVVGALASGAASARGDVYWSIGIDAPIYPAGSVGTVISNAPVYQAPPRYVAPPVVVYPPVVRAPRYYYEAPPVVYVPPPRYGHHHRHWHRDWDRRDYRWRDRNHDGRPDHWRR